MKSREAPQNDVSGSDRQLADLQRNSVYDFLYHDARRVSSFLAQFYGHGHLLSVKSTESTGQMSSTKIDTSISGAIPLVATAKGAYEQTVTDDEKDGAERTYDPLWVNALHLLDFISEKELLQRDIGNARIGQFVLISGRLAMIDLGLYRKAWDIPMIKDTIVHGAKVAETFQAKSRPERRRLSKQAKPPPSDAELSVELMALLPHSAMAAISSGERTAWCTLRDEWLTVPTSDILLKHGTSVAGNWSMVGILDALPDEPNIEIEPGIFSRHVDQLAAGMTLGRMAMTFSNFAVPARELLGRPEASYGVTPLMIFREITA